MATPFRTTVAGIAAVGLLLAVSAAGGSAAAAPAAPAQDPRVGPLFLAGTPIHVCTGSALDSTDGDLVLTAAHCIAGSGGALSFAPGYDRGVSPFGLWSVSQIYVDPAWLQSQDPQHDYAVLRVAPTGATLPTTVESAVGGGFELATAPATSSAVTVTGYPTLGDGPVSCTAPTTSTDSYPTVVCDGLGEGTSGGPWAMGPTVVGVVGGLDHGGCTDSVSYSPTFGSGTLALLDRAERRDAGDSTPFALTGTCTRS
ncbi:MULTISPECIES: trypsin-like serine protease [unclassified Rhodococcus (in: high G+C Gram-positive bacteria)]|uniref:trypsin-like serine peptidase n=1 Tax=unclassified Rhodococcus (in: high G+C Gram-positive bacteria) TaxID=192944 RepID=UPI0016396B7C|nr:MULTISPECIES: trypsin-like serine protease [unclassified Rhodococcus (in: high G+C Gram-positive bacteria)]MBC2643797.1 trypsin-like peptidase domain-containing protein [Rhodococcus sp. 3A]MBC2891462.1 trypsin-like peptidase domain-containing protein [Rhodococcus sp. 4CII]